MGLKRLEATCSISKEVSDSNSDRSTLFINISMKGIGKAFVVMLVKRNLHNTDHKGRLDITTAIVR